MKKLYILTALIFLSLYILPLGVRPIVDPDESRYGQIAREMLDSGDYIVPHLNGLRYFEKPVLGHWLNAASMKVFGENAFAVRFPSAVAVGLTAWILFFMVTRFAGNPYAGIITTLIYLTSFEVFGIGVFSVLDSMFAFFITASISCFFYSYFYSRTSNQRTTFLIACGIFTGLAFLTKGFLSFAIPFVVIVPFLIWEKKWKILFTAPWIPLVSAALVILPWAILIHLREPDFWHYFLWEEHIKRFMSDDAQHKASFFYFFLYFPLAAVPWTFLAPISFWEIVKKLSGQPVIKFAVCWLVFPFLFFSISKGKLLTYVLPCFPPFAFLVAYGLFKTSENKTIARFNISAVVAGVFFVGLAVALTIFQFTDFFHFKPYFLVWKYGMVVCGILICFLSILFSIYSRNFQRKLLVYALAPVVLMFAANFSIPDSIIPKDVPGIFFSKQADKIKPDILLVSTSNQLRSVCWFFNRDDVYILGRSGELEYGLSYKDSAWRQLNIDTFKNLVAQYSGSIALVARVDEFDKWKPLLPAPHFWDQNGQYVISIF